MNTNSHFCDGLRSAKLLLIVALIACASASNDCAAHPFDAMARARGLNEAPAIVLTAGIPCRVVEAAFIGSSKVVEVGGQEVSGATYEVACASGQGYIITKTSGSSQISEYNCNQGETYKKVRASVPTCQLPANSNNYAWMGAKIRNIRPDCIVNRVRFLGTTDSDGADKQERYEVGCAGVIGGILDLPQRENSNQTVLKYRPCMRVIGTSSHCEFTDKEELIRSFNPQIERASEGCTANDIRYIGSTQDLNYYEISCTDQAGFILLTNLSDEFKSIANCGQAMNIGGCKFSGGTIAGKSDEMPSRTISAREPMNMSDVLNIDYNPEVTKTKGCPAQLLSKGAGGFLDDKQVDEFRNQNFDILYAQAQSGYNKDDSYLVKLDRSGAYKRQNALNIDIIGSILNSIALEKNEYVKLRYIYFALNYANGQYQGDQYVYHLISPTRTLATDKPFCGNLDTIGNPLNTILFKTAKSLVYKHSNEVMIAINEAAAQNDIVRLRRYEEILHAFGAHDDKEPGLAEIQKALITAKNEVTNKLIALNDLRDIDVRRTNELRVEQKAEQDREASRKKLVAAQAEARRKSIGPTLFVKGDFEPSFWGKALPSEIETNTTEGELARRFVSEQLVAGATASNLRIGAKATTAEIVAAAVKWNSCVRDAGKEAFALTSVEIVDRKYGDREVSSFYCGLPLAGSLQKQHWFFIVFKVKGIVVATKESMRMYEKYEENGRYITCGAASKLPDNIAAGFKRANTSFRITKEIPTSSWWKGERANPKYGNGLVVIENQYGIAQIHIDTWDEFSRSGEGDMGSCGRAWVQVLMMTPQLRSALIPNNLSTLTLRAIP